MNGELTIGFTGDVMLGRTLDEVIAHRGYSYPWGDMLPVMQETDLNLINLETALTCSNQKVAKVFNFKAAPDKVPSLIKANITLANLANNHILDFAGEGLIETLATLDTAGILHVGAGKNRTEAVAPGVIIKEGIRIGVIGLTDNEQGWKATSHPGTNYVDIENQQDKAFVLSTIANLRKQSDIVIVSIHWGPNMREKPSPSFISFAHEMTDQGASIIHGHSAHLLQGIECYHKSLILYDTGDFVDDYAVDPLLRNDLSAFFQVTLTKTGLLYLRIVPVRIHHYQVNRALADDYQLLE